ncbi:unnamed protein product [Pleuronectes platessa]|uniref:Uncharacterized protein n=1 Tax=Pleuronectes platessa TaxID=8262 RepID=A0A9N7VU51_PLEPL|nr:unnamed protein product [Pleuronectes platessa]
MEAGGGAVAERQQRSGGGASRCRKASMCMKRLLHLFNRRPLAASSSQCFPVGGILDMNLIVFRENAPQTGKSIKASEPRCYLSLSEERWQREEEVVQVV